LVTVFSPDVISPPLFNSANKFPAGLAGAELVVVEDAAGEAGAGFGAGEEEELSGLKSLISTPKLDKIAI
jgi:hypothetical protein